MSYETLSEPYVGYFRDALAILDFIAESQQRRQLAAQIARPLGHVIGKSMSVLDLPPEADSIIINQAVARIGGIIATVDSERLVLTQWRGPSAEAPSTDIWIGCNPLQPDQLAEVALDPQGLRHDIVQLAIPTLA
jgi:hypothetical protein